MVAISWIARKPEWERRWLPACRLTEWRAPLPTVRFQFIAGTVLHCRKPPLEAISGHCAFDRSDKKLACKLLEGVDGNLRGRADLDEVTVRITHVAAQFVAMIIEGLGEELSAFLGPLFIARVNVCDAQIEEATYAIQIIRPGSKPEKREASKYGSVVFRIQTLASEMNAAVLCWRRSSRDGPGLAVAGSPGV
jgi:hypothetical protein